MTDQPWRHKQRPSSNFHREQDFGATYNYGNRPAGNFDGFRPRPNEQMHPAFRNDFNRPSFYPGRMMNSSTIGPNSGPFYPVGKPDFSTRPRYMGPNSYQNNQPEFLSPRQVGRFQPRFGHKNWKPQQPNFNKIVGHYNQGNYIHKYFKESMLEDPWKAFNEKKLSPENDSEKV